MTEKLNSVSLLSSSANEKIASHPIKFWVVEKYKNEKKVTGWKFIKTNFVMKWKATLSSISLHIFSIVEIETKSIFYRDCITLLSLYT